MNEEQDQNEKVSPINHDRLFKELFRTFFLQMLELFAPKTLAYNDFKKYLVSGFIGTYLKLDTTEQKKFEKELEKIMPIEQKEEALVIVTEWMERGIEQGIERGKADLILRQVKQQVGTLTAKEEKQITALSVAQLDKLGVALLKFTNKKDLTNWLAQG
jgi:Domain of unknown function (DUF4351)